MMTPFKEDDVKSLHLMNLHRRMTDSIDLHLKLMPSFKVSHHYSHKIIDHE